MHVNSELLGELTLCYAAVTIGHVAAVGVQEKACPAIATSAMASATQHGILHYSSPPALLFAVRFGDPGGLLQLFRPEAASILLHDDLRGIVYL